MPRFARFLKTSPAAKSSAAKADRLKAGGLNPVMESQHQSRRHFLSTEHGLGRMAISRGQSAVRVVSDNAGATGAQERLAQKPRSPAASPRPRHGGRCWPH